MKTALILIDHGSVRDAANKMLEDVADMARARNRYEIVEVAHMDLAEPTLAHAVDTCVRKGAEQVIVHPYFLSPGRHSRSDIPRMAREAAAHYPNLEVIVTEPLGLDERLIDVVIARAEIAVREAKEGGHALVQRCQAEKRRAT